MFRKGDIIAPREHVEEWPRWALLVDSVFPDGSIVAHSRGGGFEHTFSPDRIASHDFIVVPPELLRNPTWYYAEFWAEWMDEIFRGWTTGERWNGWGMPRFEFHEAMRYARATEASWDAQKTRYDRERNAFVTQMDEWEEVDAAMTIVVPRRGRIEVYPIGAGSWVWAEREKTPYQEGRSVKDWRPGD
jgi:hypothetical protein